MWTRLAVVTIALLVGCATAPPLLPEYTADHAGPRQNEPGSYIDYLKSSRFTHGELDRLPPYAIVSLPFGTPFSAVPRL